jgi:hypothetical protein
MVSTSTNRLLLSPVDSPDSHLIDNVVTTPALELYDAELSARFAGSSKRHSDFLLMISQANRPPQLAVRCAEGTECLAPTYSMRNESTRAFAATDRVGCGGS